MRRISILLICILLLGFLSGCWDKVEINKRVFVLTIFIDKFEEEPVESKEAKLFPDRPPDKYSITFGIANPGSIAGQGQEEPRYSISSTGVNFDDIKINVATRIGGMLNFDHLKVVIVGEKVARDEDLMKEILDVIERSPDIGRRIHLLVTPDPVKDFTALELNYQPMIALFIRDMFEKPTRPARILDADLGFILRTLHESNATVVPRITTGGKKEIKIAGCGVFKGVKMIDWFGELETANLMYLLDEIDMASLNIPFEGKTIPITVTDSSTKMRVYNEEGKIHITFDIEVEGDVNQHDFQIVGKPFDEKYIEKLGKVVEKTLKERCIITAKIITEELGADVFQADEYLRKRNPDLWEEIEGNWEEFFRNSEVEVNVRMNIRRVGSVL